MYTIKVNGTSEHNITRKGDRLILDDHETEADICQTGPNAYHIIHNLHSYNAEVVSFDREAKTAQVKINGNIYSIAAKDQFDILLEKLGLSSLNNTKVGDIKAPMPGLVLKVFVNKETEVKKGDNLFILEAMKMENIIKSPADGQVKLIKIKPGDKVEKGQVMIVF